MKILNSKSKNFDKLLDNLLLQRKKKIQSDSVSVINIIKDVKKNGDKALLKYEKRFNQNKTIIPSSKQIKKSINLLNNKVKKAIDTAYNTAGFCFPLWPGLIITILLTPATIAGIAFINTLDGYEAVEPGT